MTEPDDGGPAFPYAGGHFDRRCFGMTLRDYFAGQALAGMLSNIDVVENNTPTEVAADCYDRYADAMLRARGKVDDE